MRAVDTNVVVRLLTRDDSQQVAAAESFVANGAWVSHLVLAETCQWKTRADTGTLRPLVAALAGQRVHKLGASDPRGRWERHHHADLGRGAETRQR